MLTTQLEKFFQNKTREERLLAVMKFEEHLQEIYPEINETTSVVDYYKQHGENITYFIYWVRQKGLIKECVTFFLGAPITDFVNREFELRILLTHKLNSPVYFAISAPGGYGKSYLVEKLKRHIQQQDERRYRDWECISFKITPESTESFLIENFKSELKKPDLVNDISNISKIVTSYINKKGDTRGFYIIFEVEHNVSPDSKPVAAISNMVASLKESLHLYLDDVRIRILLIGRNIHGIKQKLKQKPIQIRWDASLEHLQPFTTNSIRERCEQIIPRLPGKDKDQIASHVFYYSGGHPGAITYILEYIRDNPSKDLPRLIKETAIRFFRENQDCPPVFQPISDDKDLEKIYNYSVVYPVITTHIVNAIKGKPVTSPLPNTLDNFVNTYSFIQYSMDKRSYFEPLCRRPRLLLLSNNEMDELLTEAKQTIQRIIKEITDKSNVDVTDNLAFAIYSLSWLEITLRTNLISLSRITKSKWQDIMEEWLSIMNIRWKNIPEEQINIDKQLLRDLLTRKSASINPFSDIIYFMHYLTEMPDLQIIDLSHEDILHLEY